MTHAPSTNPLEDALYGFGDHACDTCRHPMVRNEDVRPVTRRADGATQSFVMVEMPFLHRDPTSCPGTRGSPVIGYTTQGLAVFKTTLKDPHQPARAVAPWHQFTPAAQKEHWHNDPRFRHLEPDTTGTAWWDDDER